MKQIGSIKKTSSIDVVVEYVSKCIQDGTFKVGEKLPNEEILSKTIGVGRSSLREGMKVLKAYGMIEIRQGGGTFVTDNIAETATNFVKFIPDSDFHEFIKFRRVIEIGSIIAVYDKFKDEDIAELQELVDKLDYKNSLEDNVHADREFHKKILTYDNNTLLERNEEMLYNIRVELLYKLMCYKDIVDRTKVAHQRIIDALKAKDLIECINATSDHLTEADQNVDKIN